MLTPGCGSKIGRNIAIAFSRMGLKVALVDFNLEQTESVAIECEEKSPKNRVVSSQARRRASDSESNYKAPSSR